jgi:hypothetical protein
MHGFALAPKFLLASFSQAVDALPSARLGDAQTFILELLQGGINSPRAGLVNPAGALFELAHKLISVLGSLG